MWGQTRVYIFSKGTEFIWEFQSLGDNLTSTKRECIILENVLLHLTFVFAVYNKNNVDKRARVYV